jgi:hypothetical protein
MNNANASSQGPLERRWFETESGLRSIWVERPDAQQSSAQAQIGPEGRLVAA